jgi:hypothetical protein
MKMRALRNISGAFIHILVREKQSSSLAAALRNNEASYSGKPLVREYAP